ncbi:hypothetical protein D5F01_LYC24724 [Xyrichtys novacula]|uniref:Uncharacterized protein n=1 Tax=Xyrichtys novacula TaxID=13765 RepID=A0AAV1GCV7_XYRNO|nr:hypothetical protein D5F01_LYC24724 [Xyrichtys novacula]
MMATPRRSGFDGWTEVRFGRKGQRFRQPFRDRGNVSGRGKARAFPAPYGRRDSFPKPIQPVPHSHRPPREPGPTAKPYTSGEVRRQPADPEFGQLVRKMFSLIKVAHHLRNVDPKSRKVEPKIITRMVEILSTMIKPAVPTPETMELIKDNAEAWGYNTISTLVNHYELGFDEVMFELTELMIPQWRDAFEVAVRWAKRNLPRITDEAIGVAYARISDYVKESASNAGGDESKIFNIQPQPPIQPVKIVQSLEKPIAPSHELQKRPTAKQATEVKKVKQDRSASAFVPRPVGKIDQPQPIAKQATKVTQVKQNDDHSGGAVTPKIQREQRHITRDRDQTLGQTGVRVQETHKVKSPDLEEPDSGFDEGDVFLDSLDFSTNLEPPLFEVGR